MLSKVVTMEEILEKFHDNQTIMFGDWHGEFAADDIIDRLLEKTLKVSTPSLFPLVCRIRVSANLLKQKW